MTGIASLLHLSRAQHPGAHASSSFHLKALTAISAALIGTTLLGIGAPRAQAQAPAGQVQSGDVSEIPFSQVQLPDTYSLRLAPGAVYNIVSAKPGEVPGAWMADPNDATGAMLMGPGDQAHPGGIMLAYLSKMLNMKDGVTSKVGTLLVVSRPDGSAIGSVWAFGKEVEIRGAPDASGNGPTLLKGKVTQGKKVEVLQLGDYAAMGLVPMRSPDGIPYEDVNVGLLQPTNTPPIASTGKLTEAQTQALMTSAVAANLPLLMHAENNSAGPTSPGQVRAQADRWFQKPGVVFGAEVAGAIGLGVLAGQLEYVHPFWCAPPDPGLRPQLRGLHHPRERSQLPGLQLPGRVAFRSPVALLRTLRRRTLPGAWLRSATPGRAGCSSGPACRSRAAAASACGPSAPATPSPGPARAPCPSADPAGTGPRCP